MAVQHRDLPLAVMMDEFLLLSKRTVITLRFIPAFVHGYKNRNGAQRNDGADGQFLTT